MKIKFLVLVYSYELFNEIGREKFTPLYYELDKAVEKPNVNWVPNSSVTQTTSFSLQHLRVLSIFSMNLNTLRR